MSATFAFARSARIERRPPWARILVLAAGALAIVYPLALFFMNSLKTDAQFIVDPLGLPTEWAFSNYVDAWVQADMGRLILNSAIVSTISTLLAILLSSMFAFGLYAYRFPGAGLVLTSVVMMLTIPAQVYIIPLYVLVIKLRIINTYLALILQLTRPHARFRSGAGRDDRSADPRALSWPRPDRLRRRQLSGCRRPCRRAVGARTQPQPGDRKLARAARRLYCDDAGRLASSARPRSRPTLRTRV
jgi:hypothetical protein